MPAMQQADSKASVKLRKVGDSILIAATNYSELEATDMDGNPKFTSKGDRATDIVVTGLVVQTNGAKTSVKDESGQREDREIEIGEEVSIWFTGPKWWAWLQAAKAMAAPLEVGDMLHVQFASTEPSSNPAWSPKQIWAIKWGKTEKPELQQWVDKAHAAYRESQSVQLAPAAQPAPAVAAYDPNDEPF